MASKILTTRQSRKLFLCIQARRIVSFLAGITRRLSVVALCERTEGDRRRTAAAEENVTACRVACGADERAACVVVARPQHLSPGGASGGST
ncbi:hypothetical protein MTO96_000165 [Rhipicephalus appendiculatus]